MRKLTFVALVLVLGFVTVQNASAQKVIKLNQVEGEFTTKHLDLKPGDYIFKVTNKGADKEVGFVLAPQENNGAAGEHIKEAYLQKTINKGETSESKVVTLKEGTYNYFCPLNPTPHYTITVSSK
ncbi:cupredoxin domain-containing protein [Fulvivirgaceae bacterium BMA10]|uniref:Cupredoxin domain-containing protein n=1 Tax=Splendidivirga corallicola TaxID=3051826 RepID=A0ABT8KGJ2_9BACT|nr:cupredoxin domain-containing protein [Fulvivirgaceae bacterium BMA10]